MKRISVLAAYLALTSALCALILLASLHFLSPELDPSWRMVSEYALGRYGWVLSLMFFSWAVSSFSLLIAITSQVKTVVGKIGLGFLFLAGVGMTMGGLFDITQNLHGVAALIGIPTFPIAAVLITLSLTHAKAWSNAKELLLWTAHFTWISLLLLVVTFPIFIFTYIHGGGVMSTVPKLTITLPVGTIALIGWANRLLVLAYCIWTIKVAWTAIKLQREKIK